jgi:hypothetical protein
MVLVSNVIDAAQSSLPAAVYAENGAAIALLIGPFAILLAVFAVFAVNLQRMVGPVPQESSTLAG